MGIVEIFKGIGKHILQNKEVYVKVAGGVVVGSATTAVVMKKVFDKLEKKHRKEDAEKYKKEFSRKLKEIEEKYKNNEYLMKQKISKLCEEFGISDIDI